MVITRKFVEGLNSISPNDIDILSVYDFNVAFCKGCLSCMRNGGQCVINDEMVYILEKILFSDIIIFSFPLYAYGIPAALKVIVERMLPIYSIAIKKVDDCYEHYLQKDITKIKFVMINGAGFPYVKGNFDTTILNFKKIFGNASETIAISEVSLFNISYFAEETNPILSLIYEAGKEYALSNTISDDIKNRIQQPAISPKIYTKWLNYNQFLLDNKDY